MKTALAWLAGLLGLKPRPLAPPAASLVPPGRVLWRLQGGWTVELFALGVLANGQVYLLKRLVCPSRKRCWAINERCEVEMGPHSAYLWRRDWPCAN
jgi:hypothetical protein